MAEGGGLLNRYTVKSRIGGSNPPLSATFFHILRRWQVAEAYHLKDKHLGLTELATVRERL